MERAARDARRAGDVGPAAAWLTDGTADWFWPAAEKAGLPVMFLSPGQAGEFARIAERHPELTLIVDHMGVSRKSRQAGGFDRPDSIASQISESLRQVVRGDPQFDASLSVPRF